MHTQTIGAALVVLLSVMGCLPDKPHEPHEPQDSDTPPSNTPPAIDDVVIHPLDPTVLVEQLSCDPLGYYDPDVDDTAEQYTVTWQIGSDVLDSGPVLTGGFAKGDEVFCTITPFDDDAEGAPHSSSVVILDTPPVIDTLTLSPAGLKTHDTLQAEVTGSDADDESVTFHYMWSINGAALDGEDTDSLSGDFFSKGDTIVLTVTPSAEGVEGDSESSDVVTVLNSAPTGLSLGLSPTDPVAGWHDLECVALKEATDADGDAVSYSYAWWLNDTPYKAAVSERIDAELLRQGDRWRCESTPSDGEQIGGPQTSPEVTVSATSLLLSDHDVHPPSAGELLGFALADLGDIDGDGCSDLLIGAPEADLISGDPNVGAAYALPCAALTSEKLSLGLDAEFAFFGDAEGDGVGHAVHGPGDVDGDGVADLLIGAPGARQGGDAYGAAYLVSGAGLSSGMLMNDTPHAVILSDQIDAELGYAIASVGDLNDSGFPDLLVGAPGYDLVGEDAGVAFLIDGAELIYGETLAVHEREWTVSYRGGGVGAEAGIAVSGAGDLDGDGLADLLVAARGEFDNGTVNIIYTEEDVGSASGHFLMSTLAVSYSGSSDGDNAIAIASVGDIDGDGLSDILVGADGVDTLGDDDGAAYLISSIDLAGTSAPPINLDLASAFAVLLGEAAGDHAGQSVAGLDDFDGDTLPDLAIGAPHADGPDGLTEAGRVYVWSAPSLAAGGTMSLSEADYIYLGTSAGELSGSALEGADVDTDDLSELLVGAVGTGTGSFFILSVDPG